MADEKERRRLGGSIARRHLLQEAVEAINIDSATANRIRDQLQADRTPHRELFDTAEKKIYQLMKLESFPRFLSSDIYKDALGKNESQQASSRTKSVGNAWKPDTSNPRKTFN